MTAPNHGAVRGLWRTSAATVVCKVASSGAAGAVALLTARKLGPSGRGVLVLMLTLSAFTLLIGSLGMNISARIHLVAERDRVDCSDFLGLSIVLVIAQVVFCATIGEVLLPLVNVHLSVGEELLFGALAGSLLAPYLLNAAINAYGLITGAAAVVAAGSGAQLVLTVALYAAGVATVDPYVRVLIGGNVLQAVLGLVALRRVGVRLRPTFALGRWAVLVRTGLPAIAIDLSQALTFRVDRYMLGLFLNPAAVGVYSVAATVPELLRLPALAVGQPIFHRLASNSARVEDFNRTRRLCVGAMALAAGGTFVVAPWFVHVFFGDAYGGAVTPLRILLLAEFGITFFYLDAAFLAAGHRRVGDAATGALAGCVVVVIADLVLIPTHGIIGAAWASVIGYSVTGLVAHELLRRRNQAAWKPGLAASADVAPRPDAEPLDDRSPA
jgi:O-antigen/teichoic acid export membrane protein